MFAFGYGRGSCPPPFKFRRPRPQKSRSGGETYAERAAREAREREEQAEAKERKWQQQQEKKVRILVGRMREVLIGDRCRRDGQHQRKNAQRELKKSNMPRIMHAVRKITSLSRWLTRKCVLPSSYPLVQAAGSRSKNVYWRTVLMPMGEKC